MPATHRRSDSRSQSAAAEADEHEIRLVDATSPTSPTNQVSPTEPGPSRPSRDSSKDRRWSKGGLREELARRKYARFQENRYTEDDAPSDEGAEGDKSKIDIASANVGKALDRGRVKVREKLRSKKLRKKPKKEEAAIDILHENQRGLFLCGIPYYSSNSLLNFDPASWTDAEFQDSPVNITNAQVPDPTWTWAWKSWYVDMSHDVDEEGWEYSFSFHRNFPWHGTHPFFYSWVRRRRWLRKRVKIHSAAHHMLAESMTEAHHLNQDYFTIHAGKRETSRGSSTERADNRSSFISGRVVVDTDSESDEEVSDINSLHKAMKTMAIDRKKLAAFRTFIQNGGDEVFYLPDHIEDIMAMFVYQNSRRQILRILEDAAASSDVSAKGNEKKPSSRRGEGLKKAMDIVSNSISHLEYWSDVRLAERQAGGSEASEARSEEPNSASQKPPLNPLKTTDINTEVSSVQITGIPSSAEVDVEPGIMRPLGFGRESESDQGKSASKEKGQQMS